LNRTKAVPVRGEMAVLPGRWYIQNGFFVGDEALIEDLKIEGLVLHDIDVAILYVSHCDLISLKLVDCRIGCFVVANNSRLKGVATPGSVIREFQFFSSEFDELQISQDEVSGRIQGCRLTSVSFRGLNLKALQTRGCVFRFVDFSGVKWEGDQNLPVLTTNGDFRTLGHRAELSQLVFEKCNFMETDFSNADVTDTEFWECSFERAKFLYTDARAARFHGCNLSGIVDVGTYWGAQGRLEDGQRLGS
jgi:uncharacterized protein YjbI with pentapeptide repeats